MVELADGIESALSPVLKEFEIIFVNGCSRDNSWDMVVRLADQKNFVRGHNLMTNFGQHNALLAGIYQAHHEIIMILDDDLHHPPEEIPKLFAKLCDK